MPRPSLSLKARALQWLAQREQSRLELRRKLLMHLKAEARRMEHGARPGRPGLGGRPESPIEGGSTPRASRKARARAGTFSTGRATTDEVTGEAEPQPDERCRGSGGFLIDPQPIADPVSDATQVDAVLDWLQAQGFLSDTRFAESRLNARSARYGNLRIRQELKQHAVPLAPEAAQALRQSEPARASEVRERRFGALPQNAVERAKQGRFLAARGFSPDVIQRVMRSTSATELEND